MHIISGQVDTIETDYDTPSIGSDTIYDTDPIIVHSLIWTVNRLAVNRLQNLGGLNNPTVNLFITRVTVRIISATPDLLLIQQNLFCWHINLCADHPDVC